MADKYAEQYERMKRSYDRFREIKPGLQIRYHRITKTTSMLSSSTAITSRTGSKTTPQSKVECQI